MLSARSDTMPLTTVDDYADDLFLAQQISQVSGVAQVLDLRRPNAVDPHPGRSGQARRQRRDARGDPRHRSSAATTNAAKGTLNTRKTSFTIAANDQILDVPSQFDDVILAYRNGAPIRVRDVGQAVAEAVDRNASRPTRTTSRGILLAVFKQPGANVIDTVDQIKAQLPRLTARIPPAIKVETILDRTTHHPRLGGATSSSRSRSPSACVVLVILLFLRNFWATLHSRASPCRWRCSAPARRCICSTSASTTCR